MKNDTRAVVVDLDVVMSDACRVEMKRMWTELGVKEVQGCADVICQLGEKGWKNVKANNDHSTHTADPALKDKLVKALQRAACQRSQPVAYCACVRLRGPLARTDLVP